MGQKESKGEAGNDGGAKPDWKGDVMRQQNSLKAIKCAQRRQRAQRKSTEVKQALAVFDRIMGRKRDTSTAKLPQSE